MIMQHDHRLIRLLGGWTAACALLAAADGCGSAGGGAAPAPVAAGPNVSAPRTASGFVFSATADGRAYRVGQNIAITYSMTDQRAAGTTAQAEVSLGPNGWFYASATVGAGTVGVIAAPPPNGEPGSLWAFQMIPGETASYTDTGMVALKPGVYPITCTLNGAGVVNPDGVSTEHGATNPITITVLPAVAKPGG